MSVKGEGELQKHRNNHHETSTSSNLAAISFVYFRWIILVTADGAFKIPMQTQTARSTELTAPSVEFQSAKKFTFRSPEFLRATRYIHESRILCRLTRGHQPYCAKCHMNPMKLQNIKE